MEEGNGFKILKAKRIDKRPLGGLGVEERTTLEWILRKWVSIRGIVLIRSG